MTRLFVYRHRPAGGELSLFPSEHGGGVCFSNDTIVEQSKHYASLYVAVVDAIAPRQAAVQHVPLDTARILARIACVPMLHLVLDRAMRLERIVRCQADLSIAPAAPFASPASIERFGELAGKSYAFNQWVLASIGRAWQIPPSADEPVRPEAEPLSRNEAGFVNHLFSFADANRWRRARQRMRLLWSKHAGSVPATGMLNMRVPLLDQGLYGLGRLAHFPDHLPFTDGSFDDRLRAEVLLPAFPGIVLAVERFCGEVGLHHEPSALAAHVCGFTRAQYPTNLLEGAVDNLAIARRHLQRYRGTALISGSLGFNTQAAFLAAGARSLSMPVIGAQHGGHYGYSEEHTGTYEGEYACCDRFITWGWTQLPEHPAIVHQAAVPLPAPWLSVRQREWCRLLSERDRVRPDKAFDILFMPNKVYPFPPAPSGSHATINHVEAFAEGLQTFVLGARQAGLRVLHKPYNRITMELLADTALELERLGGEHYQLAGTFDKGLTPGLLRQCRVIVWDQPGTGLLECLTADVPTMVLWTRLYNSEPSWAIGIVAELEEVGVVHRHTETLIAAVEQVRADPLAWLREPRRAEVVRRFCREYAWVDPRWDVHWREFVAQLS